MLKFEKIILYLIILSPIGFPAILYAHSTGELVFFSLILVSMSILLIIFFKSVLYSKLQKKKTKEALCAIFLVGMGEIIIIRIGNSILTILDPKHHSPKLLSIGIFYIIFSFFLNIFLAKPKNMNYIDSIRNASTIFYSSVFTLIVPTCFLVVMTIMGLTNM